ncbi:hypothetical protein J008_02411 [Cryptococcus neoformans]|uniref:Uncharacterized protein n=2 Tax=Cryptococcus neoformans TaxID=5207 RepID=A0A854QFK1_CRYNE|nr:hypothetical protein CNAG_07827 [Cryptococcus neoformans var. grubii H99]AUB24222.1 hypothetical protein CKF44_07827 [Cryptococcus neoformans var. grubii]OWT40262.1 hypothetical protein C362_02041 [Cryptococcus neoformans var. grubii Bt1]OWZ32907.1 hypothetical protein C347_02704 [Cryptococcus neoformans var. grubii AD2-60a]OWZ45018.1 hypothetical protein C343_02636 [Cryptococcus neoformans var. grubii C23]OWZ45890.1 hypothetical protein C353_02539 [Cryptococcus neoformans var. grubii AD1-8|eukprot:XP_012048883.1 hypothetical protein CNAG_07827 [Cryptococcus neoformans var. grubii H99]
MHEDSTTLRTADGANSRHMQLEIRKSFHDDWLRVQGQGGGGPMEVKARRWKWKVEKALLSFTARQTGNSERASGAKCQHPRQHAPLPVKNRVAKKL